MYHPLLEDVLFIATCFCLIEPSSGIIHMIFMIYGNLNYTRNSMLNIHMKTIT
jgi:hypothetical protein